MVFGDIKKAVIDETVGNIYISQHAHPHIVIMIWIFDFDSSATKLARRLQFVVWTVGAHLASKLDGARAVFCYRR